MTSQTNACPRIGMPAWFVEADLKTITASRNIFTRPLATHLHQNISSTPSQACETICPYEQSIAIDTPRIPSNPWQHSHQNYTNINLRIPMKQIINKFHPIRVQPFLWLYWEWAGDLNVSTRSLPCASYNFETHSLKENLNHHQQSTGHRIPTTRASSLFNLTSTCLIRHTSRTDTSDEHYNLLRLRQQQQQK